MVDCQVLKDEKAPASALLAVFLKKYGTEGLEWDPQVIRMEIEEDFDLKLSDLQSDKLQAAITVLTTETFESQWPVFETCCHLFNNIPDDMETLDPLEAEELIAGICEATLIRHEKLEYSDEVRSYAGLVFYEYGLSEAPELFPHALLPQTHDSDDSGKNEALREIFNAHLSYVRGYLAKIQ